MISSAIEGRIRFRSPQLLDGSALKELEQRLGTTSGILRVSGNPRTGSLLVEYMPSVLSQEQLVEATGLPEEAPADVPPNRPRSNRARNMRITKRGMLVSMAAMLLFAVADKEREHVAAGMAFLAFNAYHQYTYRNRLLK
jgi:hypothetical protein